MQSSRAEDTGRTRHRWRYIVAAVLAAAVVAPLLAVASPQPAAAASATVTASGRFTYINDAGQTVGIRFATVELCDEDGSFGCEVMGRTTTDSNGNFTVVGTGGDYFGDLPDPRVRVIATSSAGRVGMSGWPHNGYCFQSQAFNNVTGGTLPFGTISTNTGLSCYNPGFSIASEAGAWQIHNRIEEAWRFTRGFSFANPGRDVPSVDVRWPSGSSAYNNSLIGLAAGDEWRDNVIWHEYGHFVMEVFAESPTPNYQNNTCDTPSFWWFEGGGHCLWAPENGSIHFTEGWPSYFADAISTSIGGSGPVGLRVHAPPTLERPSPNRGIHRGDPLGPARRSGGQPRPELVDRPADPGLRNPVGCSAGFRPRTGRPESQPSRPRSWSSGTE